MSKEPPANRLIADDADDAELPPTTLSPGLGGVRPSPTRTPRSKGGRGVYPGRRQITAHVDKALFLRLKSISALSEKPMVEIFEEALEAYAASFAAQKRFQT